MVHKCSNNRYWLVAIRYFWCSAASYIQSDLLYIAYRSAIIFVVGFNTSPAFANEETFSTLVDRRWWKMSESNRSTGTQNQYAKPLHFILHLAGMDGIEPSQCESQSLVPSPLGDIPISCKFLIIGKRTVTVRLPFGYGDWTRTSE